MKKYLTSVLQDFL